jgi:hypothetical protein
LYPGVFFFWERQRPDDREDDEDEDDVQAAAVTAGWSWIQMDLARLDIYWTLDNGETSWTAKGSTRQQFLSSSLGVPVLWKQKPNRPDWHLE